MDIKHLETKNNTAKVLVTATAKEITEATKKALEKLSKDIKVKGFRTGKVPKEVAKKQIGEEKLKQEAANLILEASVLQLIKDKKYNLLGLPQLDKADTTKKTAWTFTLSLPLNPEIKLGEYKKTVKAVLTKVKDKTKDQKLSAIVDTILKKTNITVPTVLIDREVNHSLSRLVQQTESLNLDLQTYLKSVNKTPEQIKNEYTQKADQNIKVDLILSKIGQDMKISASPAEVEALAKTSNLPPERHQSLVPIIIRRKTLDQLLTI